MNQSLQPAEISEAKFSAAKRMLDNGFGGFDQIAQAIGIPVKLLRERFEPGGKQESEPTVVLPSIEGALGPARSGEISAEPASAQSVLEVDSEEATEARTESIAPVPEGEVAAPKVTRDRPRHPRPRQPRIARAQPSPKTVDQRDEVLKPGAVADEKVVALEEPAQKITEPLWLTALRERMLLLASKLNERNDRGRNWDSMAVSLATNLPLIRRQKDLADVAEIDPAAQTSTAMRGALFDSYCHLKNTFLDRLKAVPGLAKPIVQTIELEFVMGEAKLDAYVQQPISANSQATLLLVGQQLAELSPHLLPVRNKARTVAQLTQSGSVL